MTTYKKFSEIIIIIVIILIIILTYLKIILLYHPTPATFDKYDRFYQKLVQLTDSKDLITNSIVKTSDNILLDTVYIKNPNSDLCIIFFHGNAGNLAMRFDMIKFLYNFCSVLIFDYRSYGKSTGDSIKLCCYNLQKDAQAIWNHTTQTLKIKPNNISLFGESLGCSIAISLASDLSKTMNHTNYPHSLILNSPFYSLASMIEIIFDKINIGFVGNFLTLFMGSEYKSNEWIQYMNHSTKILIAHSLRDEVIPYKEGLKLYESIANSHTNVKFINIMGTHNNLGLTDNYIYTLSDLYQE
jgi:hypothetical protein